MCCIRPRASAAAQRVLYVLYPAARFDSASCAEDFFPCTWVQSYHGTVVRLYPGTYPLSVGYNCIRYTCSIRE